jgi:NADH-quinone oxidoreductase subunit E
MAWIVKDVANQQIERRSDPYLTGAMKDRARQRVLDRFPTRRAALLPVLHMVQHEHGWIAPQAIEEIAGFLELSAAEVYDTATFYEEFFLEAPRGDYLIQICQSISCELCGHETLQEKLQSKLDVFDGETTEDGRFTLMTVECIGACDGAPAILINGRLYERVTWERLEALLDELPEDAARFNAHPAP